MMLSEQWMRLASGQGTGSWFMWETEEGGDGEIKGVTGIPVWMHVLCSKDPMLDLQGWWKETPLPPLTR